MKLLKVSTTKYKFYRNCGYYLLRGFSTTANHFENVPNLKSGNFSQQNTKILRKLNKSTPENLSKYIPLPLVQNLLNWKAKNGAFKSVENILEVEGFSEKALEEVVRNILQNLDDPNNMSILINKRLRHLVVPNLNQNILSTLNSLVAIHLEPTGIGWVKMEKQNNVVTSWTCKNFSSLPHKMITTDTFYLALELLRKTPPGDIYVFETLNSLSPQAQTKVVSVATYNQKVELISMLLALINTSVIHNSSLQQSCNKEQVTEIINKVFYLKSKTSARLFGTLIGSEKVSAVTAINNVINNSSITSDLPFSPVIFEDYVIRSFHNEFSTNKELLAQALMLGVTFMDLFVHQNSKSFQHLFSSKKMKPSV